MTERSTASPAPVPALTQVEFARISVQNCAFMLGHVSDPPSATSPQGRVDVDQRAPA